MAEEVKEDDVDVSKLAEMEDEEKLHKMVLNVFDEWSIFINFGLIVL